MNMLECMNKSIEYIEEHLLEELHMPMIAKVSGTSESDIQKTFYALTGISIVEYVRRRRLSLAGDELQKGEQSVLEVDLKYGYTCIYSEWLPNFGYEHAMLPEIEYYSAGDMMAADYKSEIWILVKK